MKSSAKQRVESKYLPVAKSSTVSKSVKSRILSFEILNDQLVVWNMAFYDFPSIGNNNPN
jgi:hypothetical protein